MKVLLIKDVYNLGRAGDVKRVADGYARNFLIPQKMAVIATAGSLKQIEKIKTAAAKQRELINEEMAGLAEQISQLALKFTAKVGETGKLFGSITQQMIIDEINAQLKINLDRHQVESQPLREEGEHTVKVRLTFDLIPEVIVLIENEDKDKQAEKGKKRSSEQKAAEPIEMAAEPDTDSSASQETSAADEDANQPEEE